VSGRTRRADGELRPMIHLARHGQTAYNAEGRFQGHLPVPLDDTGRAQAAELAEAAAGVEVRSLWCSPLARARETAAIVGARIGLEPAEDARFAETDTGDWTGRSFAEIRAEDPDGFRRFEVSDPSFRYPGGESFAEQSDRVQAGLADLRANLAALPAVVVCHRGVIRLALAAQTGGSDAGGREIPNAALVTL
jgi:broad specificity phosphatase PhoE